MRTSLAIPAAAVTAALLGAALAGAAPPDDGAFRIVSPGWVAERAPDADVRILDVRGSVAAYQHGHVPGAVYLDNGAMRIPRGGLPVQYLDAEAMAGVFERAGVRAGDTVVVYADGEEVLGATMVAYCLHRAGHRDVTIMDGGLEAYRRLHPLTQAYPDVPGGDLSPARDRSMFVTLDEVRRLMKQDGVVFLDTRPAPDYLGNTTRWMRNGHIPGAVNLDWHLLMDADNPHRFRPVAEMRRLIEAAGVTADDDVITYCGTSREATLVYHVLRHVLGFPKVRLYEGSWTEYCSHPDLPVAREAGRIIGPSTVTAHRPPVTKRLEPYECGTIKRLHTFGGLFLASQPAPEDLKQAAGSGVRTVINLRLPAEVPFDEAEVVSSLGMEYENPGFRGAPNLTDAIFDRVLKLLRTAERPILLHCSSANRVGAIWLAYRVLDGGLSWSEALEEAKTVGLRSPGYEARARDYVARHRGAARPTG